MYRVAKMSQREDVAPNLLIHKENALDLGSPSTLADHSLTPTGAAHAGVGVLFVRNQGSGSWRDGLKTKTMILRGKDAS
jgi:hypothetical protein